MSQCIDDLHVAAGELVRRGGSFPEEAWETLGRTIDIARRDELNNGDQIRAGAVERFHQETGLQVRQARPSHS